jgi:hypothetical protein
MAERITKCYPIGSEGFWSIWMNNFKIRNLYVKNIIFACFLAISTSIWHSNHRNRPSGYMSGELKSENIKYRKAPTQRSHYLAIRSTIIPSYITKPRKIFILDTRLFLQYLKDPQDHKDHTTKTLLDQQDPYRLLFILECNFN